MKKTVKRSIAVVLAVLTLLSCFGISTFAADTTGYEPLRISCTMYGDSQTQRGFTWYTENGCDASIQVVTNAEWGSPLRFSLCGRPITPDISPINNSVPKM